MSAEVDRPMSAGVDGEPGAWLVLPDVAEQLKLPVNRVHQLIRDGKLVAVRRDGVLKVPADLVVDGAVVKHLSGLLTLLSDAGYDDEEVVRWLYTADDSLPGTPAQALVENRATEVKRRAQALGF
ncbi:Rv2175c family DNA-binding protein [Fodinicola acaciae]|uniref:Rv2175c family DNA-binding protein n=1 Tax=Fodinicola acaciae TaxID=2681555 RepID=UPI001FE89670|nr:Rv2175c family DNA-binding protein [Fodinicola acaciae]